jgi:hypothetical protein
MAPSARRFARIVGSALLSSTLLSFSGHARGIDVTPAVVELDPAATQVAFTLRATLHTVAGTFVLKHGTVMLDPATGKAEGLVVVDAAGAGRAGDPRRREGARRIDLDAGL